MAKVEIDTPGVTIRVEDADASAETLGAQALVLYERANAIDRTQPTGAAAGLHAERRPENTLGFGRRHSQAPAPYQHHNGGGTGP